MADIKQRISRNLRSARQWLTRAEEAFNRDQGIRGELDLLLAQAELQHAREQHRLRQWRYKYPLLRHGLALVLAVSVAAGGAGAYWWLQRQEAAIPIPLATLEPRPAAVEKTAPQGQEQPRPEIAKPVTVAAQPAIESPKPAATVRQEPAVKEARPGGHDVNLPPEEIQKLIRAAGKSLRGQ